MSGNKHYLLSYEHKEIENILNRVYTGMLLTKEDYDYLINRIGIKNISTFDGYYNSLEGKPDIDYMIAIAIAENNKKVAEEITKEIDTKDEQLLELLEIHIQEYEKLINDLQTGMIKLDKETKDIIDNSVKELNKVLENQVTDIEGVLENKADKEHIHLIDEIYDLFEILELKSNVSHGHETDHVHTNKDLLDAINEFTIKKWDAKVDEDEIPVRLSELINDLEFLTRKDLEQYLKDTLPDFDKFSLRDDCDYFLDGKADLFHLHTMNQIEDLEVTLSTKVDKEKGKVLIDKELVKKIEEHLRKKEEISDGNHVHNNMNVLNSITDIDLLYWNEKVDPREMHQYVADQLGAYTTTELIKNYYTKEETYSREEIHDKIAEYGFGTAEDFDERLGGLTLVPITQEEFNALSDDVKNDKTILHVITDAEEVNLDRFITKDQLDILLSESDGVVTDAELETRLDGLVFKKIKQKDYLALSEDERNSEDVLYVITDSYEYDVSEFVTEELLHEKINLLDDKLNNLKMPTSTTSGRPAEPVIGQCFFDTDLGMPIWFNGTVWVNATGQEV